MDLLSLIDESRKLSPATKKSYTYGVKKWLEYAGTDPANWTLSTCQAFYDKLIADGLNVDTAKGIVKGSVSFALRRASGYDRSIIDVTKKVDCYKRVFDADDASNRHALTGPQVKALLAVCGGSDLVAMRDHALIVLGLYTGMRRTSITTIDTDTVIDKGTHVTLRAYVKGGYWDRIPLDKRAWELTAPYREALVIARRYRGAHCDALFPRFAPRLLPGHVIAPIIPVTRLSPDGLYKALDERAKAAGITPFFPHLFRHTFISWCRVAGIEDYLIEIITRHRGSTSLINRVYTDKELLESDVTRQCYETITEALNK